MKKNIMKKIVTAFGVCCSIFCATNLCTQRSHAAFYNYDYLIYEVEVDDNLTVIAYEYDCTIQELQQVNLLESEHIEPGDELIIPNVILHTICVGDDLSAIASIYDSSVESIRIANGMAEDEWIIQPDNSLIVPVDSMFVMGTINSNQSSEIEEISTTETTIVETTTTTITTTETSTSTTTTTTTTHTTTSATETSTSTTTANTECTTITSITSSSSAAGNSMSQLSIDFSNTAKRTTESFVYSVKSGDTLTKIAQKYNVSIQKILNWNPKIKDPNKIYVGQQISLNSTQREEETEETVTNSSPYYIVKSGDMLSSIAKKNNTTVSALLKANPGIKDANLIYVGQKIYLTSTENGNGNTNTRPETPSGGVHNLPDEVLYVLNEQKKKYPGLKVGVGVYKGNTSYVYNQNSLISGGCTVKAAYAMFVLTECERRGIDIYNTYLTYKEGMKNDGSGTIKYEQYGNRYSINYLVKKLLQISDNTAYNILCSEFSISNFQKFLNKIDGQQLWGRQYGSATVQDRANEWKAIIDYTKSGSKYSNVLYNYLDIAQYGYIEQGMDKYHTVLHKSGWCDGSSYTCACDCAWIDEEYLVVIMTQDYSTGKAHTDVVRALAGAIEDYFG